MKGSFKTALIAAIVAAVVSTGAAVATTQTFILGTTDRVNAATKTTNLQGNGTTVNPVDAPLLTLENKSTTTNATPLSLLASANHSPFKVNTQTKVTNLNADQLDGRDSTYFLPASTVRTVGPIAATPSGDPVTVATIGQLTFFGQCLGGSGGKESESLNIFTSADHAAYADLTQAGAGTTFGNADMNVSQAGGIYTLADFNNVPDGTPTFTPVTGEAVSADGHEIFYNLYMGVNARGGTGDACIFGGSFIVK